MRIPLDRQTSTKQMRRSLQVGFGVVGALLVATGAVFWTAPGWLVDRLTRWYPGCLYRVPTEAPLVALTIDDGSDPRTTPPDSGGAASPRRAGDVLPDC